MKVELIISIRSKDVEEFEIILIIPPFPLHNILLNFESFILIEELFTKERAIIPALG